MHIISVKIKRRGITSVSMSIVSIRMSISDFKQGYVAGFFRRIALSRKVKNIGKFVGHEHSCSFKSRSTVRSMQLSKMEYLGQQSPEEIDEIWVGVAMEV